MARVLDIIYMTKQSTQSSGSSRQADTRPQDWERARDVVRDWLLDGRDMSESDRSIDRLLSRLAQLRLSPQSVRQGD